tara:strand:+ start:158 stop:538 length:381 start_codon:yes stop_codon:yes gene_type:complete
MYPNNTQQENTLTVVTTATIQLNLDGTWKVIAFESDDKSQTKIDTYNWNWDGTPDPIDEEPVIEQVIEKGVGISYKVRKPRAKETKTRKPRIRSHCKKCGMKGKNILTCLSTVDSKGKPRSQHHRL